MILQTLGVAAQPALDLVGGLFEARVRLVGAAFGLQPCARAQMQRAIGAVGGALRRNDDVSADLAVKIAADQRLDLLGDMRSQ